MVDLENLDRQIEELKLHPDIKSVVRKGNVVEVTYKNYEALVNKLSLQKKNYRNFKIELNFGVNTVVHHDKTLFVQRVSYRPLRGRRQRARLAGFYNHFSDDETMGLSESSARALNRMRERGELVSILQYIKNFTSHRWNEAYVYTDEMLKKGHGAAMFGPEFGPKV